MTVKEIAIKTIHQLPEDATWEDIQERINFVAGVRKGLRRTQRRKGHCSSEGEGGVRGMAFKLIWSPSAQLDLKDIAAFIAEDNPSAAQRFVESLFQVVERLADFPESGRIVPEFDDPSIREVIRRPCRIVYRIDREERYH